VRNIIGLIEGISGLALIFLTVIVVLKGKKTAEELRPFVKEEEKRIIEASWWKVGTFERDIFLLKAYKKFKREMPSLVQFRNLFWARNFFLLLTLVILLIDFRVYG
jgi:hypothetical protein